MHAYVWVRVRVCVRARMGACVRACMRVCVEGVPCSASSSVRTSFTQSASEIQCTFLSTQSKPFHVLSGIPFPCIQRLSISVLICSALLPCSRAMAGMMVPSLSSSRAVPTLSHSAPIPSIMLMARVLPWSAVISGMVGFWSVGEVGVVMQHSPSTCLCSNTAVWLRITCILTVVLLVIFGGGANFLHFRGFSFRHEMKSPQNFQLVFHTSAKVFVS